MGADSVLVNAALKLGMARVPGDTAEIFNKQYEGLIAYHKASSEAAVEAVKLGGIVARKGVNAVGNWIDGGKNAAKKKQKLQDTTEIVYGNKRKKKKGTTA